MLLLPKLERLVFVDWFLVRVFPTDIDILCTTLMTDCACALPQLRDAGICFLLRTERRFQIIHSSIMRLSFGRLLFTRGFRRDGVRQSK